MGKIKQANIVVLLALLFSALITSCASIPELKVHYQLPPLSDQLKGQKVVLAFEDARRKNEVLGQGAKNQFKGFPGNFSFSVARFDERGFKIGIFQLSAMIMEGFRRRLENLGLEVVFEQSNRDPQLLIILNEFLLDLVNRKWEVKMSYEARLIMEGEVLSTHTISVQGMRYRLVVGRGGANTVLGEAFTDMVNKLDVFRLFQ